MKDSAACRQEIDAIDAELSALLEKHMRVAESAA